MKKQILSVLLLFFIVATAFAKPEKFIDLTHALDAQTLYFPAGQSFQLHKIHAGMTPNHYYAAENAFETGEHIGTHMDAPNHFAKDHPGIDQIPLRDLIGLAVNIDVRPKTLSQRDYQINIQDIQDWEAKHGQIPPRTIILLQTGYSQFWPDRKAYMGTTKLGIAGVKALHFPGLDPKAAQWLISKRQIKAVGIDTGSIDYGQTQQFGSHQMFTQHNIPIFENITQLEKVPAKNFYIYALPMKIAQGTGAPLRIVAVIQ